MYKCLSQMWNNFSKVRTKYLFDLHFSPVLSRCILASATKKGAVRIVIWKAFLFCCVISTPAQHFFSVLHVSATQQLIRQLLEDILHSDTFWFHLSRRFFSAIFSPYSCFEVSWARTVTLDRHQPAQSVKEGKIWCFEPFFHLQNKRLCSRLEASVPISGFI